MLKGLVQYCIYERLIPTWPIGRGMRALGWSSAAIRAHGVCLMSADNVPKTKNRPACVWFTLIPQFQNDLIDTGLINPPPSPRQKVGVQKGQKIFNRQYLQIKRHLGLTSTMICYTRRSWIMHLWFDCLSYLGLWKVGFIDWGVGCID